MIVKGKARSLPHTDCGPHHTAVGEGAVMRWLPGMHGGAHPRLGSVRPLPATQSKPVSLTIPLYGSTETWWEMSRSGKRGINVVSRHEARGEPAGGSRLRICTHVVSEEHLLRLFDQILDNPFPAEVGERDPIDL